MLRWNKKIGSGQKNINGPEKGGDMENLLQGHQNPNKKEDGTMENTFKKLDDVVREYEDKKVVQGNGTTKDQSEYVSTWVRNECKVLLGNLVEGECIKLRDFSSGLTDQVEGSTTIPRKKLDDRMVLYIRNCWKDMGGRIVRVGSRAFLTI